MHAIKLNLGIAVFAFGLGYFVAQSLNQPVINAAQPGTPAATVKPPRKENFNPAILQDMVQAKHAEQLINQHNAAEIKDFIEQTPEPTINSYLKKAFPTADLSAIDDKKKFSSRLIDELSNSDIQAQNLAGQLAISTNTLMPRKSEDLSQVYKSQEIFAHFDTMGKFPQDNQVFVRWTNRDTGEILLFTPTNINAATQQNWISFAPAQGWKVGQYDVKYYQLNNDLTPIAQSSFSIHQVIQ